MAAVPVTCITVIDESQNSQSNANTTSQWSAFRATYPTRRFYLLDPGGGGGIFTPTAYQNDPIAFGPITVNRDGGNTANRSDWFSICGLNGLPAGTIVSLAVDTSGSMRLSTVRASYDWFISKCNIAGFNLIVDTTFPNERWILPHDKSLPPNLSLTVSPSTINFGQSATLTWEASGDVNSASITNIGNVSTSGSITVSPTSTTVYELYAVGAGGQNTVSTTLTVIPIPIINSFTANPNPQTSGSDGIPNYNTTLSWTTQNTTFTTVNQGVGTQSGSGTRTASITNLPQSTAGSNSPATRTYTLTAGNGFTSVTQTLTVSVYNDNSPNNYTIANQTNLFPNTLTTTNTTVISGIDMITTVSAGPGVQVSNNGTNWSSTTTVTNNNQIFARATSPPFNTDPSGLTNSSEFYIDVGPLRRFFTLTTRAPDVNESFDYPNFDDKLPFPDIDTIPGSPDQYIQTNLLSIDDIEIPVEIKTNNANVQVRITKSGVAGNWQDVRNI
jgi:hypothetical protein